MEVLFAILVVALAVIVYMLPTFVAAQRREKYGGVIAINVFLGWTLVGWVVAFALALAGDPKKAATAVDPEWTRECRSCRSKIHPEATVCPFCRAEQSKAPPIVERTCQVCLNSVPSTVSACPFCKTRLPREVAT